MNKILGSLFALSLAALGQAAPAYTGTYSVAQTFHVGGEGAGWDYVTVDSKNKLLFLSHASHVTVVNSTTGAVVADIAGQKRNHGVLLVPSSGRGFITDGDDGSVVVFDLKTYAVLGKIKTEDDSDGILYDSASKKVWVVSGDGASVLSFSPDIDIATGKAESSIDLGGKPEYLAADGKGKIFIALTDKDQVAVVDTKTRKVVDKWSTAPGGVPISMGIDNKTHRLFVGCRKPQKVVVMSATDGKVLADAPIGDGVDATKVDGSDVFDSARDGTVTVTRETSPGHFESVQTIKTGIWSGTSGVDTKTNTLYVPIADFPPGTTLEKRPPPSPDSFSVLVIKRSGQ